MLRVGSKLPPHRRRACRRDRITRPLPKSAASSLPHGLRPRFTTAESKGLEGSNPVRSTSQARFAQLSGDPPEIPAFTQLFARARGPEKRALPMVRAIFGDSSPPHGEPSPFSVLDKRDTADRLSISRFRCPSASDFLRDRQGRFRTRGMILSLSRRSRYQAFCRATRTNSAVCGQSTSPFQRCSDYERRR